MIQQSHPWAYIQGKPQFKKTVTSMLYPMFNGATPCCTPMFIAALFTVARTWK